MWAVIVRQTLADGEDRNIVGARNQHAAQAAGCSGVTVSTAVSKSSELFSISTWDRRLLAEQFLAGLRATNTTLNADKYAGELRDPVGPDGASAFHALLLETLHHAGAPGG